MAEIVVITLAGVAGVVFPQAGTSDGGEALARLRESLPALAALGHALALDRVFRSVWFLSAVALAFASLLVVAVEEVRRLLRARSRQLPTAGGLLIHAGLLLVILAAVLKALFGAEAMVDVMEGETLPPTSAAWAVQKPGAWVSPLRVANPVTLESVDARRYTAGDLQSLAVRLRLSGEEATAPRMADVPVNKSAEASGVRLFVGSEYGPAALIEWKGPSEVTASTAVLLKHERGQRFAGKLAGPDGARAYLRAEVNSAGNRPGGFEVRVMKGSSLLFAGVVRIGETITLPSGSSLALHGAPFWVRLHANRDPALWLLYLGFACVFLGVTVRFTLIPVPQPASAPVRVPSCERHVGARMPQPTLLLVLACVLGLTACDRSSPTQARQLVERYNTVVSEAYRRGDVKLVDGVVGPGEGRKLTGLIGVRLDLGLTLDSTMLSLDVLDTEQSKDELRVRTRERWSSCDRRIGTGEQVGEISEDTYDMRYYFKRAEKDWLVDRIEFVTPPQFGSPPKTWTMAHGRAQGTNVSQTVSKEVATP
ncbi:MAG: cytochrome c biogenesis protein ResB [bacterium]